MHAQLSNLVTDMLTEGRGRGQCAQRLTRRSQLRNRWTAAVFITGPLAIVVPQLIL